MADEREPLEVRTERDTSARGVPVLRVPVLRVLWRRPPARRFERFVIVPKGRQTLEELEAVAGEAAERVAAELEAGQRPPSPVGGGFV